MSARGESSGEWREREVRAAASGESGGEKQWQEAAARVESEW